MKRLLFVVTMTAALVSCKPSAKVDPTYDRNDPGLRRAMAVAEAAFTYRQAHSEFPDSLKRFRKFIKLTADRGFTELNAQWVFDAEHEPLTGNVGCTYYCPTWQYPSMTLVGERQRRIVGFLVIGFQGSSAAYVVDARYGPDSHPVLIVRGRGI